MRKPPLLPTEALRRVLAVAKFDGSSLLIVAGGFSLLSAWSHDLFGMVAGLLVALAGAIELHGAGLLQAIEPRGMRWLVSSQIYLLVIVLAYAGFRLLHVDTSLLKMALNADLERTITESGMSVDAFLKAAYLLSYLALGGISILYQGGMAVYYLRRRNAVVAALEE